MDRLCGNGKTADAVVISLDARWKNIGSRSLTWGGTRKDVRGNVTLGEVFSTRQGNFTKARIPN